MLEKPRSWIDGLSGGASAVHGVGGAGDVARLVGRKERHDGSDLGGVA